MAITKNMFIMSYNTTKFNFHSFLKQFNIHFCYQITYSFAHYLSLFYAKILNPNISFIIPL